MVGPNTSDGHTTKLMSRSVVQRFVVFLDFRVKARVKSLIDMISDVSVTGASLIDNTVETVSGNCPVTASR